MKGTYGGDREWSDRFIPQIKQIVGPRLLDAAPLERDVREATDLIVLHARDMRIAARVRRHGYLPRYKFEFTLRCRRDSGVETEESKIINGWGDWLFYGHAHESELAICLWWLIDLHAFRAAMIRNRNNRNGGLAYGVKPNGDGTFFRWFDVRSFQQHRPPLLVASSEPLADSSDQLPLFQGAAE